MGLDFKTNVQYLKGVGEKRAKLYAKLGIATVWDLLYHFPRDYVDLSKPYSIVDAPIGDTCAVRATLTKKSRAQRIRGNLALNKLEAEDDTGILHITMFNSQWTVDALNLDEDYIFYGRFSGNLLKREIISPIIYKPSATHEILPIYPQTSGINSKFMRQNLLQCLKECDITQDTIPQEILDNYNLLPLSQALNDIHFPRNLEDAKTARDRFVFEELLTLSLGLCMLGGENDKRVVQPLKPHNLATFYKTLPYKPTNAQLKAIDDAVADMQSAHPMNRLVQGDVGSGKTLVAAAAIWFVAQNGKQSALMVPTEILAEQHYKTLLKLLEPFQIRVELLTGSTTAKDKKAIRQRLLSGEIDCIVGTHALLSDGVDFSDLSLVITDEQHRFGVGQRAQLSLKSANSHTLVMSATPIPRTLSLIIFGDLKISVIDELPPGRIAIETLLIHGNKRPRALGFIKDAINDGRQAYIVCPLVEQGEMDLDLKPATQYAHDLAASEFKGYSVGLLHGKLKAREKEDIMRRFKDGEIQVLVSTTVIEVGVDVPNATIIMIENAERFGLSQLHQLRGRVGRGAEKSWCILLSDARGETTRERLAVMKDTADGFKVAEFDLKQRGPGDFFGMRQHGLPTLKVASLAENLETMQRAQDCAKEILQADNDLTKPENQGLREEVARMMRAVGDRPN